MSRPVDVLAVMADAAAQDLSILCSGADDAGYNQMLQARAAVAELIDAAEYVSEYVVNYSPLTYSPVACKEANDRLRLALARVSPMTREQQAEQAGVRG